MKTLLKLLFLIAIQPAFASNGGGNGGHPYAAEFQRHMDTIVDEIDACELWNDAEISQKMISAKLDADIAATKIEIKKRGKLIDKFGNTVAALNFPKKKKIQVLQGGWENLTGKTEAKRILVLHEYLGIHGEAEVDTYRFSQHILDLIETCRSTTNRLDSVQSTKEGPVAGNVISIAQNRKTKASIILSKEEGKLHMYVSEFGDVKKIKTINIFAQASEIELKTESSYRFRFFNRMKRASANAFYWLYSEDAGVLQAASGLGGAIGVFTFSTGGFWAVGAAVTIMGVAPATPFVVGLLGVPFEAAGSTFKYLFGKEAVAYRKFRRMTKGKYVKASDRVFDTMVKRIKEL